MIYKDIAYAFFAVAIAMLYGAIATYAWKSRMAPGSIPLAFMMLCAGMYAVPYILMLDSPNLQNALLWYHISLPGASFVSPAWLLFSLQYSRQNTAIPRRLLIYLSIIPVLTCLAAWTNSLHGMYGSEFRFDSSSAWPVLEWKFGLFYWINFYYAYIVTGTGLALLFRQAFFRYQYFSRQTLLLVAGASIPIVLNIVFVMGYTPIPKMDIAPFSFLITGVFWAMAILRYGFMDMVPFAREKMFECIPTGVVILDTKRRIVDMNPAARQIIGLKDQSWVGRTLDEVHSHIFRSQLPASFQEEISQEICIATGKDPRYMTMQLLPLKDRAKKWTGAIILLQDITALKRAVLYNQEQREISEVLRATAEDFNSSLELEEVLDHILKNLGRLVPHDGAHLLLIDPNNQSIRQARFSGIYARQPGGSSLPWACANRLMSQLQHSSMPRQFIGKEIHDGCAVCMGRSAVRASVSVPVRAHGQWIGLLVIDRLTPDEFSEKQLDHLSQFATQTAFALENARLYTEMQEFAVRDELTGALNRRGLMECITRELSRSSRAHKQVGLIWFDLDQFKIVNDQFGHSTGDLVLRSVVRQCLANIREMDVLGRYGGDEFIVLLPESSHETLAVVGERLRRCVESHPIQTAAGSFMVTISLGAMLCDPDHFNLEELLQNTDQAMYRAKQAGRNQVCIYEPVKNY